MQIIGQFEIAYVHADGRRVPIRRMRNTILYTGYDLLAQMSASSTYINGLYLEYLNGVPVDPTPIALARDRSYYTGLVAPSGYCRLATLSEPSFSASAAEYTGNVVTFEAITDGTSAGGAAIVDGSTQFFTTALISMPSGADPTQDLLYNATTIQASSVFAPVPKVANVQVSVRCAIQFVSSLIS